MPWNNQNGGGGPWGGGGQGGGGPWGQGPRGPSGGGPQGTPPDLEDIIRRGQDRLKQAMPGGGKVNPAFLGLIGVAVAIFWLFQAIYTVQPDELAIELRFGKPKDEVSQPGLHFHWWPVETVEKANVAEKLINIGDMRGGVSTGLMLSGDQNIVDVKFSIAYQVVNPSHYLFRVQTPDEMVRQVGESAMREVVGRRPAQDVFRDDREGIAADVRSIVQATLDEYGTGLGVNAISIEDAAPPQEVADAFEEVQRAEQDEDRFIEEANQYSNQQLGRARGEAAQIREYALREASEQARRQIDAYVADRDLLSEMLAARGNPADILIADEFLTVEPYALAMRRGEDRLRLIADRTIAGIYRSGEILEVEMVLVTMQATAAQNLRKAVHYARRALGDEAALRGEHGVLVLWPGAEITTDVEVFERAGIEHLRWVDDIVIAGSDPRAGLELVRGALPDLVEPLDEDVDPRPIGGDARVEIFWPRLPLEPLLRGTPSDVNSNSIVLRVSFGSTSFLFTGDIGSETEAVLLRSMSPVAATVLKVAHHGSAYSSQPGFLARVGARAAVISCGAGNSYGHPANATLRHLAASGARILRTDVLGDIRAVSDGAAVKIYAPRSVLGLGVFPGAERRQNSAVHSPAAPSAPGTSGGNGATACTSP